MRCRHCQTSLRHVFVDLGTAPASNAYLTRESVKQPEKWFPLRVFVCDQCWLAQTEDFASADELFNGDYAYFSGYSSSWLRHSENYVNAMIARFELAAASHVVEVAANDGYLLQYFQNKSIPCTGIEPTASTAAAARAKGLDIVEDFFGVRLAKQFAERDRLADLTVSNNVLAHVPDINDFVAGYEVLLKPQGVATFEFPHLFQLIAENQFDTIYHEHFSYLSLTAVDRIFGSNGLSVFDVEELPTHGGSLRVFAQRRESGRRPRNTRVDELLLRESQAGMQKAEYYTGFSPKAEVAKNDFLTFLLDAKRRGKTVAAYGAAAKGNTLLNFAGVRRDLISFVVDRNPSKQGKYLPGSRIPIQDESALRDARPDYVIVLPWNLKQEIVAQLDYIRGWNGQFVTAIPHLQIS